jgi:hypothetical protein
MSGFRRSRFQHDVMNQIGVVLGFSDLLLEEMEPSDPRRADVQEIATAARRAMELIEQWNDDEGEPA